MHSQSTEYPPGGPAASLADYSAGDLARWVSASKDKSWHDVIVAELDRREQGATVAVRPSAALAQREPGFTGEQLLDEARVFLNHFAEWPSPAALDAAVAYAAMCHGRDGKGMPVWAYCPRFMLLSREGGSGKSWMARLISQLAPEGHMLIEMTPAAFVQKISEHKTIVVDESDILFGAGGRAEKVRALINGGYEPDQATSRMRGRQAEDVPLFGPVILAGLDKLKTATGGSLTTMLSRCIIVHVRRAADGYRAPRYDATARAIAARGRDRLAGWMAQQVAQGIGTVVPEVPEGLGNRPASLWEPLLAVADAAGGRWPEAIRSACVELESASGLPEEDEQQSAEMDAIVASWAVQDQS